MKVKNKAVFTRYATHLKDADVTEKQIVKAIKEAAIEIKEAIENQ